MSETIGTEHWPDEIRYISEDKRLEVGFDNGVRFSYPAELLRVESPSAEVQGHSASQKKTVAGRRHVGFMAIEPVGNYAIRIRFDDLHDTVLCSWKFPFQFGENQDAIWQTYLDAIEAQGLSREPERRS